MSKSTSRQESVDQARELEEITSELYGVLPDAFAAARDARVRAARASGQAWLARDVSRLRRPTQSAWLVNQLWREQRKLVQEFLALADELSRAQAQASGPELQRLTVERRDQEVALLRAARALVGSAGVSFSPGLEREVQETLSAALARPEVADEVRTGRLVKAATYAGFGTLMPSAVAPGADAAVSKPTQGEAEQSSGQTTLGGETAARVDTAARAVTDDHDRVARAAQRARERRDEADRDLHTARVALESAAAAVAESTSAAEAAQQQDSAVRQQVAQLEEQLRELQAKLDEAQKHAAAAGAASLAAARRRLQTQQAHQTALRAFELSQEKLEQAAL